MSYTPFVYGRTSHESGGQQAFSLAFILLCFLCFFCFLCPVFRIMFWRFWFLLKVTEENSESAAAIRLQHATAKPHKVNLKAITATTRFNYKSRSRVHSGCCETPVYPVQTHTRQSAPSSYLNDHVTPCKSPWFWKVSWCFLCLSSSWPSAHQCGIVSFWSEAIEVPKASSGNEVSHTFAFCDVV